MLSNNIPTNEQYARDIRSDRLRELYRQLAFGSIALMIVVPVYGAIGAIIPANTINIVLTGIVLFIGLFVTHSLFGREQQTAASWAFAATLVATMATVLHTEHVRTLQVVPFLIMVLAFPIALLLDKRARYVFIAAAIVAILSSPILAAGELVLYPHQLAAVIGIMMALYLAERSAQEMVEMTGWALETYRHERRTHDELFDQREALQRTVVRSEILAKEMSRSNRDLAEALAQAEEAATKRGQFLSNMSHELRTPLNAIIGFSETMIKFPTMYNESQLPSVYERDISQIYSSGRQLLHIVNDILDLNRVDAGELEVRQERVSLDDVIYGVTATAKGLIGGKPIKLHEDLPNPLPIAYADESRVRQVLLNLYSNAVKYTDEGFIQLTVRAADDEVEFKLQDTGHGIPAEDHDKLFNQFEQAANRRKDPTSGTGLGLAICKELVTLMSGDIWFESQVGEGSTFYFTVPRYRGEDTTTPVRPAGTTFFDDDRTLPASDTGHA
jgi:signal transduction histidine kinase